MKKPRILRNLIEIFIMNVHSYLSKHLMYLNDTQKMIIELRKTPGYFFWTGSVIIYLHYVASICACDFLLPNVRTRCLNGSIKQRIYLNFWLTQNYASNVNLPVIRLGTSQFNPYRKIVLYKYTAPFQTYLADVSLSCGVACS